MSNQGETEIFATDLPIALYLNQRLTFDVLAALEGGFSHFRSVQTTASGGTATEASGGAQLGLGNSFALLGVKLGGQRSRQEEEGRSENITEEIVHTPASLFARLRKELRGLRLVREVSQPVSIDDIVPGTFVEFEATLRRSPIVELLTTLSQLAPLLQILDSPASQPESKRGRVGRGGKEQRRQSQGNNGSIENQIEQFQRAVTAEGSQDLIAELGELRVVLTTEQNYFLDPTMNDVIDGTFRVFGKVSRVIPQDSHEKISLLRKSPIGKFGDTIQGAGKEFADARSLNLGDTLETEVQGPAMQVIPLAIFS